MKTGIIIPCYNEENRLNTKSFLEFINTHEDYHLCFVNDGSKDNTIDVLNQISKKAKHPVSVLNVVKNSGKASAVRNGARYLYNKADIDYIGFIDADLSTDFEDLKDLVNTLKENKNLQMVYGSRSKSNGNIKRNIFRNFFSKVIKQIVYLILFLPIEDTQCGAKVFRKSIIPVAYDKEFRTKWLFDVEIFLRIKKHIGCKTKVMNTIYEQALKRWTHVEDSKLGLRDSLRIPFTLLNLWFFYQISEPILK